MLRVLQVSSGFDSVSLRTVVLVLASLVSCALPISSVALEASDDLGRTVRLAAAAQRIISLAPHVTELLYAAGAGDKLVGAVSFSDYPVAAQKLPRIGTHDRLDAEAILALRPDLVVGWDTGNGKAALTQLERLSFNVFITEPRHLADVAKTLEALGTLAGTEAAARAAAKAYRERLAALEACCRQRPSVSVFYQVWNEPLFTVNGAHLINQVIEVCGGRNVFAALPTLAPVVDKEAVLAANPEVIIASGMDESRPEWLEAWRRFPQLIAVRDDNLFFIPPDLLQRHTPRLLDGAERVCRQLEVARSRRHK